MLIVRGRLREEKKRKRKSQGDYLEEVESGGVVGRKGVREGGKG